MDYPNIEAMASGTISGKFTEWPRVRPEAKALLAELAALREENARLKADMAFHMGNARVFEADLKTARRERDEARAELAPMSCHHAKWCDDDGRCTVCTLHANLAEDQVCRECSGEGGIAWPCPTVRALEGEE